MEDQSYYYPKHNIASLNYQSYSAASNDYAASAYNESTPQSLYHGVLNSHSSTNQTGNSSTTNTNSHCSGLATASNATNYTRTASYNQSNATDYSSAAYGRYYQAYAADPTLANTTNLSTTTSSTADCNNLSYGTAAYTSKSYDTTTHSSHVPVIAAATAATSNSSQSSNYHPNTINYGSSYANIDYNTQKTLNANYGSAAAAASMLSAQNRAALSSSAAYASNAIDQSMQAPAKSRGSSTAESKQSGKTSVIKPNTYNAAAAPINYTKYGTYAAYGNPKTNPSLDKLASSGNGGSSSSRDTYNVSNHKSGELYYPEPISARYANPGYALNVTTPATAHTNPTYLTSNNYIYGHHLAQPQSTVHHGRNSILTANGFQTVLDDPMQASYYNRQNSLVVRPTPNTYKQCQIPYPNAYYARNPSGSSSGTGVPSAASLSKSQAQKLVSDPTSLGLDSSVDRRYMHKQYASMYGANYLNASSNYDDYSQYSGYATPNVNAAASFFPTTTQAQKMMYNYNHSLNAYNTNVNGSHLSLSSSQGGLSSMVPSTTSIPTTTVTTTASIVQQPIPINPNTTPLISSNYDSSLHAILPPLYKDYGSQYAQGSYPPSHILYQTLQQSANYLSSMKSAGVVGPSEKMYADKVKDRYGVDLEEQINSSRILKQAAKQSSQGQQVSHTSAAMSTATTTTTGAAVSSATAAPIATMPTVYGGMMSNRDYDIQMKAAGESNATRMRNAAIVNSYDGYGGNGEYYYHRDSRRVHPHHMSWPDARVTSGTTTTVTISITTTTPTTTTAAAPPVYRHRKKQNLREFLSSWNEFEDEDVSEASRNRTVKSNQYNATGTGGAQATSSTPNVIHFEKRDKHSENTVVVQPIPQFPQPSQHLIPNPILPPQSYHHHHHNPHHHHHSHHHQQSLPTASVQPLIPKITIVDVDNGTQNLPDVVIDTEKQKSNNGAECFERANVIQTIPKLNPEKVVVSERPLTDINTFKHVSMVNENELPSNIVLPPIPPLRHEDSIPEPVKSASDSDTSQTRFFDVELGRLDDEKNVVECKNTITMRKIIKKYLKQDYLRRKKPSGNNGSQQAVNARISSHDTNSNLSTPLKSLSPAHEFDMHSTSNGIFSASYPVDLSTHNKESVEELINNWSMCSGGSGDSGSDFDLNEIMRMTSWPEAENASNQMMIDRLETNTATQMTETIDLSGSDCEEPSNAEQADDLKWPVDEKKEEAKHVADDECEKVEKVEMEKVENDQEEKCEKDEKEVEDGDDKMKPEAEQVLDVELVRETEVKVPEIVMNEGAVNVIVNETVAEKSIDESVKMTENDADITNDKDEAQTKSDDTATEFEAEPMEIEHTTSEPVEQQPLVIHSRRQEDVFPSAQEAIVETQHIAHAQIEEIAHNESAENTTKIDEPVHVIDCDCESVDSDHGSEHSSESSSDNSSEDSSDSSSEHSSDSGHSGRQRESVVVGEPHNWGDLNVDDSSETMGSIDDYTGAFPNEANNTDTDDNESVDLSTQLVIDCDEASKLPSPVSIETLQTICVQEMNTKEFREYFTASVMKQQSGEVDDSTEPIERNNQLSQSSHESTDAIDENEIIDYINRVPSLRTLARRAIMENQKRMSLNLKSAQIAYSEECDSRVGDVPDTNRVKTLKELAHEVANTIYSFNVKPLQDICKLAIDKYNQLYQMHCMEMEQTLQSVYVEESENEEQVNATGKSNAYP